MEQTVSKIEELLEKPCYVIDFLPEQVKPSSRGQFFDVECYLLNSDELKAADWNTKEPGNLLCIDQTELSK